MKASDIGLRQAQLICRMSHADRLTFIAEGLPILRNSARSLLDAARELQGRPREIAILEGQCNEESAKALILLDIVRCPRKKAASRIGPMIRWFYDHLARLIYIEAQSWRPMDAGDLQAYVDDSRKSHYLEGEFGEFVMQNWLILRRETKLYADVYGDEEGRAVWWPPVAPDLLYTFTPAGYAVVDALDALGVLSRPGLEVLHQVWDEHEVDESTQWSTTVFRLNQLVDRLAAENLVTDRATEEHYSVLKNRWQLPMYNIDFSRIDVDLDGLLVGRGSVDVHF